MNTEEKLSCLTDRPCTVCKFHKENGCCKWSCVFEEKDDSGEGKYIKIDDLGDTVLRLNNDGWGITRNEHTLISNVLYEMPLYSFPNREKGEWINTEEEGQYKCNKCGEICGFKKDKTYGYYVAEDLCPNCGADMRGEK